MVVKQENASHGVEYCCLGFVYVFLLTTLLCHECIIVVVTVRLTFEDVYLMNRTFGVDLMVLQVTYTLACC